MAASGPPTNIALGGTLVFRRNQVANPVEEDLYQGERFGNFSYHIPLAPGKYRLTLHFRRDLVRYAGIAPTRSR